MNQPIGYFTTDHAVNMTLRDYFAAKAMEGLLEHMDIMHEITRQAVANRAYQMADAMMKAREAK